jgi:hypothetical protein
MCVSPAEPYPWTITLPGRNIDLNEFPNVKRWLDEIGERLQ